METKVAHALLVDLRKARATHGLAPSAPTVTAAQDRDPIGAVAHYLADYLAQRTADPTGSASQVIEARSQLETALLELLGSL